MNLKIIYEDNDVMVIDKPAGVVVFPEGQTTENTLIDELIEKYPALKSVGEAPRHGVVHRLDKDTSGILLVAKTTEALIFLQKQFKNREVAKKYICLVEGAIKDDSGAITAMISRSPGDPRKQTVWRNASAASQSAREAITEYKVLERFKDYTLLEVEIKTGRRHQIRAVMAHLQHPIAGDILYAFKNSPVPTGLTRQFLHAAYLKIQLPNKEVKEFSLPLPAELEAIIKNLEKTQ